MQTEWINAIWGGVLIGIAVSLMLLWSGRVAGVSGILYGIFNQRAGDVAILFPSFAQFDLWIIYFWSGLGARRLLSWPRVGIIVFTAASTIYFYCRNAFRHVDF